MGFQVARKKFTTGENFRDNIDKVDRGGQSTLF